MPNAVNLFMHETLLAALFSSVVCSSMRPQKYLQGIPDANQPSYMGVTKVAPHHIEEMVDGLDQDNGFVTGPGGKPVFLDESVPEDMRPVSRRVGIAFNQRAGMTDKEQKLSTAQSWAPLPEGCNEWREAYATGAKNMSKTSEVIEDLNYMSALKQAMNTGQPIDAPIEDDLFLQAQYERICRSKKRPLDLDLDYPAEQMRGRKKLNGVWDMSSGHKANVKKRANGIFKELTSYSKLTRADQRKVDQQLNNSRRQLSRSAPAPTMGGGGTKRPRPVTNVVPMRSYNSSSSAKRAALHSSGNNNTNNQNME